MVKDGLSQSKSFYDHQRRTVAVLWDLDGWERSLGGNPDGGGLWGFLRRLGRSARHTL